MQKKHISKTSLNKRLLVVLLLVAFIFTALIGRLIHIQIVSQEMLMSRAASQWARDLPIRADRGQITDVNGVPLVVNRSLFDVYIRPNSMKEPARAADIIARAVGRNYEYVYERVSKRGVSEVTIVRNISKNQMLVIDSHQIQGVFFGLASGRFAPFGNFATQILGYTNADNVGQTGVEYFYNDFLRGVDGQVLTQTDLIGRPLENSPQQFLPSIPGMDVRLTIDKHIQGFAERAVNEAVMRFQARGALAVVMNPQTGAILASAQAPSFDLNDPPRDDLNFLFDASKNKAITGVYEPGSTFKILTSAIGLEERVFRDSHRFHCPGYRRIDGERIRCWRSLGHGSQLFAEGVANSCNCVFMDIAASLGPEVMYDWLEKFGIMEKTGIDAVGETGSLMLPLKTVRTVDIARIGFGQAVAITPIQLMRAVAGSITGTLPTPHLVAGITDIAGNNVFSPSTTNKPQVVSQNTAAEMRQILHGAVLNGGGRNASVAGFSIGGKTGTAQKYAGGQIAQGRYISSFIGFSCVENPEYLVLMIVDEPEGYMYYGSLVAAPYARNIFEGIFALRGKQPTFPEGGAPTQLVMPDLIGMSVTAAFVELRRLGLVSELSGEGGRILYQIPAAGTRIDTSHVVFMRS
jgi:stage V sporulation protein D (sporulation-specific penicillin-binding protein)